MTRDGPVIVLPHFTASIVGRSLLAWAFVRVATMAANGAAESALHLPPSNPLHLTPGATLFVLAVVGATGWISARRRNEDAFLRCLGHSRARHLATIVAPPALLELAMAMMA